MSKKIITTLSIIAVVTLFSALSIVFQVKAGCGSYCVIDGKMTYDGKIIERFDVDTEKSFSELEFVDIQDEYNGIKDKNYVYYQGEIIADADPTSFKFLSDNYAKDQKSVYYKSCESNPDDPMGGGKCKFQKVDRADPQTFKIIQNDRAGFAADKNYIFYNGSLLKNADRASFEYIGYYAKDINHVYVHEDKLEGADSETFEFLDKVNPYLFAKDKNRLYFQGEIVENGDPASIQSIGYAYYKDKGQVYFLNERPDFTLLEKIEDADSSSFGVICMGYAKDAHHVYFGSKVIEYANPETFAVVWDEGGWNYYGKDTNSVYYYGKVLPGSDPKTFEFMKDWDHCAKDKNNIYRVGKIIENSDGDSFQYLNDGYTKDKNQIYYHCDKIEDAHYDTFKVYSKGYAKDKDSMYFEGKRIEEQTEEVRQIFEEPKKPNKLNFLQKFWKAVKNIFNKIFN